jgi:hypothetical protein
MRNGYVIGMNLAKRIESLSNFFETGACWLQPRLPVTPPPH